MGDLFVGGTRPARILLGAKDVSKLYIGTSLVWQNRPDVWTHFDNGYVDDIAWGANIIPNYGDATYGEASLGYVAADGYMRLRIRNGNTANTHYANLATTNLIYIPSGATALHINGSAYSNSPTIRFGLLVANAANSIDVTNGGIVSPLITPSGTYVTQTLALPVDLPRDAQYRIAITARGQANMDRYYRIKKVWFT